MPDNDDHYLPPLLTNTDQSDIRIYTSDGWVPTHKLVLASISDYLRSLLLDISDENVCIILPDYGHAQIEILLTSIYQFQIPDKSVSELLKTLAIKLSLNNNVESEITLTNTNSKCFKGRKKKSVVWDHFLQDSEHRDKCVCQYCYKTIVANRGSTSSMLKHLVLYHYTSFRTFGL